ncbi:MAG TPA: Uma2 family endonuclease [Pyrinomonadaceae bacterium]|nr:Uma2 family endonuclease [Pyrinomonadaceae bacterium]
MVQTIPSPPETIATWLALDLTSIRLTHQQFRQVCRDNPDLRLELTSSGGLMVMPPAGSRTGHRNSNLTQQLGTWAKKDNTGMAFDSSAGFTLPNEAVLSPDVSWVRRERWDALKEDEQEGFAPLCPDFVIELRSHWNTLKAQQQKMQEYLDNGTQLGWLIDPGERRVYIYRPGEQVEVLTDLAMVSAEPVLKGFVLHLAELW